MITYFLILLVREFASQEIIWNGAGLAWFFAATFDLISIGIMFCSMYKIVQLLTRRD